MIKEYMYYDFTVSWIAITIWYSLGQLTVDKWRLDWLCLHYLQGATLIFVYLSSRKLQVGSYR